MLSLCSLKVAVEKEFDSRHLASKVRYNSLRNVVAFIESHFEGKVSCLEMDKKQFIACFCKGTGYSASGALKGAVNELYHQYNILKDAPVITETYNSPITVSKSSVKSPIIDLSYSKVESFPPLIDRNSEVLILGTAPGTESLRTGQYYTSSHNKFWTIISYVYNDGKAFGSYDEKVKCLQEHHIALWDVNKICDRVRCADSTICNSEKNDIEGLLRQYPNLKRIILNGNTAAKGFHASIPYVKVISSAAMVTVENKIKNWEPVLKFQ